MYGHEDDVKEALQNPEEMCAVSKKQEGEGFLVTAYPTDAIKAGEKIWPK